MPMTRMKQRAIIVAIAVAFLASTPTHAQEETKERARALFEEAWRLMDAGQYEPACKSFDDSYKLNETTSTLLGLAQCHERLGRIATAAATFARAATVAHRHDDLAREREARENARRLQQRSPKLIIRLASPSASVDLVVSLDGDALDKTLLNTPIPVDPGEHIVTATRPGKWESTPIRTRVEREGQIVSVEIVPPREDSAVVEQPPMEPPSEPRSFWRRHRWSLISGTTAVVLAAAATGVGLWTWSSYADLAETCGGAGCPQDDLDAVENKALATNLLFGAAGVAAIVTVVLYLIVEREPRDAERVSITPTASGASVTIHF